MYFSLASKENTLRDIIKTTIRNRSYALWKKASYVNPDDYFNETWEILQKDKDIPKHRNTHIKHITDIMHELEEKYTANELKMKYEYGR